MCEDCISENGPEMAAVRKVLTHMAGYDPDEDHVPNSEVQLASEAVERFNDLAETVAELRQVVDTDMGTLRYDQMTKKDKVRQVRAYLVEQAKGGRPFMTYDQVVTLFNGHPSPGHAYDLMKLAGNAEGFEYQEPNDERPNRLVVNVDGVKDDAPFHAANNAPTGQTP